MFLGTEINIPSYEANQYRQNIHNAQAPVTKDTNVFIQGKVFTYATEKEKQYVCSLIRGKVVIFCCILLF